LARLWLELGQLWVYKTIRVELKPLEAEMDKALPTIPFCARPWILGAA
jgi:hypothetical protein